MSPMTAPRNRTDESPEWQLLLLTIEEGHELMPLAERTPLAAFMPLAEPTTFAERMACTEPVPLAEFVPRAVFVPLV